MYQPKATTPPMAIDLKKKKKKNQFSFQSRFATHRGQQRLAWASTIEQNHLNQAVVAVAAAQTTRTTTTRTVVGSPLQSHQRLCCRQRSVDAATPTTKHCDANV
jgi:hypothetical protein